MKNLKLLAVSLILAFALGSVVLAQEIPEVTQDEEVTAQDLGISEPKVLPDSPFYFLKNWGRAIGLFFAFGPVKKAELRLKIANEKLIEAKKLAEMKKDPKLIEKALNEFQNEIGKISQESGENLKQFSAKLIHQQILHQKILQKLETQVPPEVYEEIKAQREKHLEKFAQVMQKVEAKDKIAETLVNELEKVKGSEFKEFKSLELLREIEEKMPKEVKEKIRAKRLEKIEELAKKLEKMSEEEKERFKIYVEQISGDKEKKLEILENLKEKLEKPQTVKKVEEIKEKVKESGGVLEELEKKLPPPQIKMTCEQRCKFLGYQGGTCRKWVTDPSQACKENEIGLKDDLIDCRVIYPILSVGKICCCQK
jgi:DNA repair exonuclease SbcCD ATPase subunit